ncbi:MAG: hypothetical protein MAG795_00365 [Candidatus Woesearchaeota archaeon]|nr:hypothetical protein [Candidatus Woesearchaeota archaeon]
MNKSRDYHIGITDPVRVRRDLLESTRAVIHMLQRYEQVEELRAEKREEINQLKDIFTEIRQLSSKLKIVFPKIHVPEKKKTKLRRTKKSPKQRADLKHLEKELDNIESKLSGLRHG